MSSQSRQSEIETSETWEVDVSVVVPIFKNDQSIGNVIESISRSLEQESTSFEIVAGDISGTTSDSAVVDLAREKGARVVQNRAGYAPATIDAIQQTRGKIIVLIDPEPAYNFDQLPDLVEASIDNEDHLIVGKRIPEYDSESVIHNRMLDRILVYTLSIFHGINVDDQNGPYVGSRGLLDRLDLSAQRAKLRTEILVSASDLNVPIQQIPITYDPDQQLGAFEVDKDISIVKYILFYGIFSDLSLLAISSIGTILGIYGLASNSLILSSTMAVWVILAVIIFVQRFSRIMRGIASDT